MFGMFDLTGWIAEASTLTALIVIGLLVFAESGLLIGVFLPGDTLLIAVGLFAAQGHIPLVPALAVIALAAILGDNAGYLFGRKTGPRLFRRKNGRVFRREYPIRARRFFKQHGSKAVFLGRFIPYVRTFTPIVAGVARMYRPAFVTYNIAGAVAWTVITVLIGYWVGERIPHIEQYFLAGVVIIVLSVFGPALWQVVRSRQARS